MAGKRARYAKLRTSSRLQLIEVFPENAPPTEKMSEILLALLGPLADEVAEPEADLELANSLLTFAATIWNVSRIDDSGERGAWIRRYTESHLLDLAEPDIGAALRAIPEAIAFYTELVELALSLWPDDNRLVIKAWGYLDDSGELRIRAVSQEIAHGRDQEVGYQATSSSPPLPLLGLRPPASTSRP